MTLEFQEFAFFIVATSTFIVFIDILTNWNRKSGNNFLNKLEPLPGPLNFPYIGSLLQIGLAAGSGQLYEQYHNICDLYGKVMGARIGSLRLAVVEDYTTARDILCSADWTSRFPVSPHYRVHTMGKHLGIIFSYGDEWKEMRRFSIRTLKEFGFGELSVAEQYLNEELLGFLDHFEEMRCQSNSSLKMNGVFKISMLNITWRIVTGVRMDYRDEEAMEIIRLLEKVTTEIEIGLHPYYAFPWLKYIPGIYPLRAVEESFAQIHQYLGKILDERRRSKNRQNQANFLDRLIQKAEEEKLNPNTIYTDEQFLCIFTDIFVGSLDTTSNSFEFAILYMIKYPEVQRKVQAEIDLVIGRDRMPDVYDRSRLPYTEATMLETLRHANVLPFTSRTSTVDTELCGCHVAKDTFCVINLTAMHMDEEIWGEDVKEFRPERFLDSSNSIIRDNKLLAFGAGKRLCIGFSMSRIVWMAFFAAFLQKYTFSISEEYPNISTVPISGFTNSAREYYCKVTLR